MKSGHVVVVIFVLLLLWPAQTFAGQDSSEGTPAVLVPQPLPSADRPEIHPAQVQQEPQDYETDEQGGENDEEITHIADPLYPWNKAMYHFNDRLYFWALKPVAEGYSKVMPEDIRTAVSNFFYNLLTPVRFVGDIMQLKIEKAGDEVVRLVYNSTAGVFGLADAAKADLDIARHDEDLGQTLGSYGIGHGFYIVWPFIGPSSLRDSIGFFGDGFLTPVYYVSPWTASLGIDATDKVNHTSLHIGEYEDFKESAIDPYVAIRNAYVQHRKKEVEE